MDVLDDFDLLAPRSVAEAVKARRDHPGSRLLGGGTDLVVNLRRGIGPAPRALIDVRGIGEMRGVELDGRRFRIGAGVSLTELAVHPEVVRSLPGVAAAAGSVAGPTHRNMGTVGGNLCLDTRCIYYNQSEWWRAANRYCLKYRGDICHVAPGSRVCYATYSGDLAPAFLVLGAQVEVAGPRGVRTVALDDLFTRDGQDYLRLDADEMVVAVRGGLDAELRAGYDKRRIRRSIEYPVAGVAVALRREGDVLADLRVAFTGTNPWPLRLEGVDAVLGRPLDEAGVGKLGSLMSKQVMAMRTTFTSGHYRRRVAAVIARRLIQRLYDEAGAVAPG